MTWNAWSWDEKDGSLVHPDKNSFPIFVVWTNCNIMTWFACTPEPLERSDNTGPGPPSLPRQQGSWHHLFTSAHLPQFALASSVSGYSQKVADLLESMAESLGRLQELDIGDINVVYTTKLERYRLRSVKSRWKQILSTEVVVQYADEYSWSCILWNQKKCLEIKPPKFFHDHRVLFFLVDRSALIIGNLFFRSYLQVRSCRKGGGTRTSLLPGFAGFTWKGL